MPLNTIALMGVKPNPASSSPMSRAMRLWAQERLRKRLPEPSEPGIPMRPNMPGRKPSWPAAYTRRPEVNVVAFKPPKQLKTTIMARMSEPRGPKTTDPNWTAMALELSRMDAGSTKM